MIHVEITVKGEISTQWSEWFDNLSITYSPNDRTVLSGPVTDQAALHGLLSRLWNLGLPLISVRTEAAPMPSETIHVNVRAIIERETPSGMEILLQIRNKPHEGGQSIELPGGRVEPYESLIEAILREVREETGLGITKIEGFHDRIETGGTDLNVECLAPFSVYQTLRGPVDSFGVYFRCQAEGELLMSGDETECARWIPVKQVAEWLREDICQDKDAPKKHISWVDRAGLVFYMFYLNKVT